MSEYLLEVIACSVEDAQEAERGGAGRLEVVRDLHVGGLTPPFQLVREILNVVSIPIRVMIRERSDSSAGTDAELQRLCLLAAEVASLPIDGLVMGFLTGTEIDGKALNSVLSQVPHCRVTFHHAFDALANPLYGIERLSQICQVDRILTAGGSGSWPDRKRRLVAYSERESPGLKVLAGGGMSAHTIQELSHDTHIREFHVGTAARDETRVSRRQVEALSKLPANGGGISRQKVSRQLVTSKT
jgi:copper homeostasis protein